MKENNKIQENLCLIDTDILIYIIRNNKKVIEKSKQYQEKYGELKISELTYYECMRGYKIINATKKLELFLKLTQMIEIIPLTRKIYNNASEIYAILRKIGCQTGEFDLLIATTALENNLTLVTNNTKHYIKIKEHFNLKINNWMK